MNKKGILLFLLACVAGLVLHAQAPFNNCAAAFLDGRMVVDEYSPSGKCVIDRHAGGELTLCAVDLSPEKVAPMEKALFMVALRDANTGTLNMFSTATYQELDIRRVLEKCKPGDRIVLLTIDPRYAVPHAEILVQ
jgi:hypothetical protein